MRLTFTTLRIIWPPWLALQTGWMTFAMIHGEAWWLGVLQIFFIVISTAFTALVWITYRHIP